MMTFVQLLHEATQAKNYRCAPSSRFRWMAVNIYTGEGLSHGAVMRGLAGTARYYKTKQLAETWAKATFRLYAVGKVQGFL
jgi:hypothetical protein